MLQWQSWSKKKKKKKLKMAANANIDQKKEDWTRA